MKHAKEFEEKLTLGADRFLGAPLIDTSIALVVFGADGRFGEIKTKLAKLYGENAEIAVDGKKTVLRDAAGGDVIEVEAQSDFDKARYNAVDALRVCARLIRPNDGCPWDRAQTHESIRINMIEEAYEAVDAIDKRDAENMCEEFGDVFLQSILQSDIAQKNGEFDFDDVCDGLCKKLIGRHTFIFGGDSAGDPDEALTLWEKAKAVEKKYDTVKNQLERMPQNFPSLLFCQKTYKKLKKAGAASDPKSDFDAAVSKRDYTALICACVALLCDDGKDAEIELNKHLKSIVDAL